MVYEKSDVVVKNNPVNSIEKKESFDVDLKNEILKEIDNLVNQLKERNYIITSQKLPTFKPVLREQLLKRFNNEQLVDESIEEYFKNI